MPLNLRYLEHNEIDFERWDRCVGSRNKPQPYGFSWYLNWVAPGWTAIVYGDYEAVLPVFPKVKKGFTFTTRPYGTQALGPFATIPLSAEWTQDFIERAMAEVQYGEFFISPEVPVPSHWTGQNFSNYVLNTNTSYENLKAGYTSQTKRNLKKAEKAKLDFGNWPTVQDLIRLWQNTTQERTHITDENMHSLGKVLEFCVYQKRGQILAAYGEGNSLVAGQFWVQWHGRSTLLLNASTSDGKALGAPTLLIDQMIQSKAGLDHCIDFEGSSIPGLARFYRGFGASDEPFYFHVDNRLPWWAKWMKTKTTRS
jgi:hypothetical protein